MIKNKGITLISLIITIIILIILAGISINMILGNEGLLNKAKYATESYSNAQLQEEVDIAKLTNKIDSNINGNRDTVTIDKDEYENLKKKGSWELLASNDTANQNEYTIKNIENFSSIVILSYNGTELMGSNEFPTSRIIDGKIIGAYATMGSYYGYVVFKSNEKVVLYCYSGPTLVELYGIY